MGEVEKSLNTLAKEINAESHAFVAGLRRTLHHGIRAGEKLAEAKALVPHGQWTTWVERNVDMSMRSCQEFMRLYNNRDEILAKARDSAHLSVSDALKEISAPKDEEETSEEEPAEEEGLTDSIKDLPDERVGELVREWVSLPTFLPENLSDVEKQALEARLTKVGGRERELLSQLNYEHLMLLGLQVAQDGFLFEERGGQVFIEWRDETKEKLVVVIK